MKEKKLILKISNLCCFILTIVINFLANYLPLNNQTTKEVARFFHSPLNPASFTFIIWDLIYLLIFIFIIYQMSNKGKINQQFSTGPYFIIASFANWSWILSWHYEYIYLTMFSILVLLLSLIKLYKRLNSYQNYSRLEYLILKLPFSIYTAWVSFAAIANFLVVLIYSDINWPHHFLVVTSIIGILLSLLVNVKVLEKYQDIAFSIVIFWSYLGVISSQALSCQSNLSIIIIIIAAIIIMVLKLFNLYSLNSSY